MSTLVYVGGGGSHQLVYVNKFRLYIFKFSYNFWWKFPISFSFKLNFFASLQNTTLIFKSNFGFSFKHESKKFPVTVYVNKGGGIRQMSTLVNMEGGGGQKSTKSSLCSLCAIPDWNQVFGTDKIYTDFLIFLKVDRLKSICLANQKIGVKPCTRQCSQLKQPTPFARNIELTLSLLSNLN